MAVASSSTNDDLVVCGLQLELRQPDESPQHALDRTLQAIKEYKIQHDDIDLFFMPELAPVGYMEDTFANYLPKSPEMQAFYQSMDQQFAKTAHELGVYICYGTVGWKTARDDDRLDLFIRANIVDRQGQLVASYDKINLCDYGDCAETRFFTPGTAPVAFNVDNSWKLGVIICADIRYPTLSRTLTQQHGVDVVLQCAVFARDLSFYTWRAFCTTRAVENGVYFCAVNAAGDYYGESSWTPPWVDEQHVPHVLGTERGPLVARLSRQVLNQARTEMPFHRKLMAER